MCYKPYEVCLGRKYRKVPKLNRPLVIIFNTFVCNSNNYFTEKDKIRLLQQVIRWFYKDSLGFRVDAYFKNNINCDIKEGDFIHLICHATKAILRKLFLILNHQMDDYKLLKRRKYTLIFTFIFCDVSKTPNKNITLDITTQYNDTFKIFITMDLYYAKDFIQFLFYYYNEEYKEPCIYM